MIRNASSRDAEPMAAIYAEALRAGEAGYHDTPPSLEEFKGWLFNELETYSALVDEDESGVVGWCAVRRFHERAAYAPTAELFAYVTPGPQREGRGYELISSAVSSVRARGLHSLLTIVTLSERFPRVLAAHLGFEQVGLLPAIGRRASLGVFQLRVSAREQVQ